MLTDIPPALLHRVRDAAAYVHDLAELGLALLCPCDDNHGAGARWLLAEDEETADGLGGLDEERDPAAGLAGPGRQGAEEGGDAGAPAGPVREADQVRPDRPVDALSAAG